MEQIRNNGLDFHSAEVREIRGNRNIQPPQEVDTKAEEQEVSQAKKKGGRKPMNYNVEAVVDFVKREKAIHEPVIADITFVSTDKKLVRELAVRQFLLAYDMTEDYAAKILCYMYDKRVLIEGRGVYYRGNQEIADALNLSYPTVQKIVQKLHRGGAIFKYRIKNSYIFPHFTDKFFESISNNAQILLTFEAEEEEQLEAINEDGTLNEEMTN